MSFLSVYGFFNSIKVLVLAGAILFSAGVLAYITDTIKRSARAEVEMEQLIEINKENARLSKIQQVVLNKMVDKEKQIMNELEGMKKKQEESNRLILEIPESGKGELCRIDCFLP